MADKLPKTTQPIFAGARRNWREVLIFSFGVMLYWFATFITFLYFGPEIATYQVVSRSLASAGATYIGVALLCSLVFKWFPLTARHWPLRRALGVAGFLFALAHVVTVSWNYFGGNLASIFYSFNPLVNPMIFGVLAFPIFFVMTITATDWAVAKLGGQLWKNIQRLVYFGYLFLVFHFLLIVPDLGSLWPGMVLLIVTVLVLVGQLYWWLKISAAKGFRTMGTVIGLIIIGLYLGIGYLAFVAK